MSEAMRHRARGAQQALHCTKTMENVGEKGIPLHLHWVQSNWERCRLVPSSTRCLCAKSTSHTDNTAPVLVTSRVPSVGHRGHGAVLHPHRPWPQELVMGRGQRPSPRAAGPGSTGPHGDTARSFTSNERCAKEIQ